MVTVLNTTINILKKHKKDLILLAVTIPAFALLIIALAHTFLWGVYKGGAPIFQLALPTLACYLAIQVGGQRAPINSLLCLMGVFLCTAVLYFSVGASYFALVFMLIGQGAVAILFLYAVILLPMGVTAPTHPTKIDPTKLFSITAIVLFITVTLPGVAVGFTSYFANNYPFYAHNESSTLEAVRHAVTIGANDILAYTTLYAENSSLFMLLTAILLTAMLGAIILAKGADNP
jgi:NADH:ubiquinone oxidoreductase subunit 6 (subunit J)